MNPQQPSRRRTLRPMNRRLALAAAPLILLAACSSGGSSSESSTVTETVTSSSSAPSASADESTATESSSESDIFTPDDSGVDETEMTFVTFARQQLPGLEIMPGAKITALADYACGRIETTPINTLWDDFVEYAPKVYEKVSWDRSTARTFISDANVAWCSDKTMMPAS